MSDAGAVTIVIPVRGGQRSEHAATEDSPTARRAVSGATDDRASRALQRAVASAVAQRPARVIVIDHGGSDDTLEERLRGHDVRVDVLRAPATATLGAVRSLGLGAIATEFAMWLDADDELIPGRAARLLELLRAERADFAFDEIDLHDGETGEFVRRLPIPAFMRQPGAMARLFERNFLPGPGVPLFRTASARALGFDATLHGAEDFDLLLRAVASGRRIALDADAGYRQFAWPSSLSRQRDNQAAMLRAALMKHDPNVVLTLLAQSGFDSRAAAWTLVSFHTFRDEIELALSWLDRLDASTLDRDDIFEPDGPWPFAEGWRLDFRRGTLLAARGDYALAAHHLRRAVAVEATAEALNNLGVVQVARGDTTEALALFDRALALVPAYADAAANRADPAASRLTKLPLRREAMREDYL